MHQCHQLNHLLSRIDSTLTFKMIQEFEQDYYQSDSRNLGAVHLLRPLLKKYQIFGQEFYY
jgi:hypothetical protein